VPVNREWYTFKFSASLLRRESQVAVGWCKRIYGPPEFGVDFQIFHKNLDIFKYIHIFVDICASQCDQARTDVYELLLDKYKHIQIFRNL
jgi:hypothetical protein